MNTNYPHVLDEVTTLDKLHAGWSIARYGDGEFKLVTGSPKNVSQVNSPALRDELAKILKTRFNQCLVGIPDMNPKLPKAHIWRRYMLEYAQQLDPKAIYASAFISRPDSAPHINTASYFDKVEALWRGKRVTLVGNNERSLTKDFLIATGAKAVVLVKCPKRDAYAEIDAIEKEVKDAGLTRVIICGGAMGTCLAARLSTTEFQGIDLGHIGMFWRTYAK